MVGVGGEQRHGIKHRQNDQPDLRLQAFRQATVDFFQRRRELTDQDIAELLVDAVRKKRLEELEQKKKRLEEMRKSKKEREDDAAQLASSASSIGRDANKHEDVDDLVKSLLGNDNGAKGSASSASNAAAAM